ncbi:MAG: hypothetical protein K6V73_04320 [Firmicutes bacterium]|nr:hypothetical protein [Bacillota bacterium]
MAASVVRVSALRLGLETFADETAMVRAMTARLQALALEGAQLCVYPGLYGLCLAGPWPPAIPWTQTLRAAGDLREAFVAVAARAARNAHVYLVPGSVLMPQGGGYTEWAGLFGPDGSLLGEQGATQPSETLPDLVPAARLAPIPTPLGPIGLLVGDDADVPDVARILTLQGARLLVAPRAPRAPYTAMRAMAGLWQAVQQNQVYGVESGLRGPAAGAERGGKAGAFAPGELTPDGSGFLGRPGYYVGEGSLAADLDFERLDDLRRRRPLARHLNAALYRRGAAAFGGEPGAARAAAAGEDHA